MMDPDHQSLDLDLESESPDIPKRGRNCNTSNSDIMYFVFRNWRLLNYARDHPLYHKIFNCTTFDSINNFVAKVRVATCEQVYFPPALAVSDGVVYHDFDLLTVCSCHPFLLKSPLDFLSIVKGSGPITSAICCSKCHAPARTG